MRQRTIDTAILDELDLSELPMRQRTHLIAAAVIASLSELPMRQRTEIGGLVPLLSSF